MGDSKGGGGRGGGKKSKTPTGAAIQSAVDDARSDFEALNFDPNNDVHTAMRAGVDRLDAKEFALQNLDRLSPSEFTGYFEAAQMKGHPSQSPNLLRAEALMLRRAYDNASPEQQRHFLENGMPGSQRAAGPMRDTINHINRNPPPPPTLSAPRRRQMSRSEEDAFLAELGL